MSDKKPGSGRSIGSKTINNSQKPNSITRDGNYMGPKINPPKTKPPKKK